MSFMDDPLVAIEGGPHQSGDMWSPNLDDDVDVDVLAEAFFEAGGANVGDDSGLGLSAVGDDDLLEPSSQNAMFDPILHSQQTGFPETANPLQPVPVSPNGSTSTPGGMNGAVPPQFDMPNSAPGAAGWPAFMGMMDPQQQGFVYATPNPLMNAEQQQQMQQQQQVAILPNPFLAMAAGMPMMDRAQFIEAAFAARARNRRRQNSMTQEQTERRRERNRVLAKKTRDRKKDYMTGLQDELLELQRANAELKAMVRNNIDEKDSTPLLNQCNAIDKVPETVWEACGTDKKELSAEDFDMVSSIQKSQTAFLITDPSFDDNPIVFVSPDFLKMTGYSREQVIGRNCRFLQGTATDPDKVETIRRGLAEGEDVGVTLVNYRADGTPFWNRLFIAAVRDIHDNIVNYMSVSVEVARPEPGDPEHDKVL